MQVSSESAPVARTERVAVAFLMIVQVGLLAYSATRHSPTDLEPAFLVSGISHWKFNRFELYRTNPPLVRMVAAIPVIAVGCNTNWSQFHDSPRGRVEYLLGQEFVRANGAGTTWLLCYSRWACIPFSLIGGYFAYLWARSLYGAKAGFVTLVLFLFEPNLLAHAELITPDSAATAFGIVAGFAFWQWLRQPSWICVLLAGCALGLAQLCKTSWIILFPLWVALWFAWRWMEPRSPSNQSVTSQNSASSSNLYLSFSQLASILLIAVYLINIGYVFDGFCTPLKEFQFVSKSFSGLDQPGLEGNRFRNSWMGNLPVPLPRQYVLGIDRQKLDFESYYLPSYLRGEVRRHGGWWYYYAYGLLVKIPCGTWGLLAFVLVRRLMQTTRLVPLRDEIVLLVPSITLFLLVSSQTEFNRHLRYVFPSLGVALIFLGQAGKWLTRQQFWSGLVVIVLVLESVISLAMVYPHQLAYFNQFAGGPMNGYRHLTGSSLDWGQDLLYLRDYVQKTGQTVIEIRHSDISRELAQVILPSFGSNTGGQRIIVVSPNCQEKEIPFPPAKGRMLTPTLCIVDYETESQKTK